MHPGKIPARVRFPRRPMAYLSAPAPAEPSGLLLRRSQMARRHPSRRWRFPRRPKAYLTYGGGGGAIAGIGPIGATTFVLSLQPGTKVIYGWSTSIYSTHSGTEQRESTLALPKQRYEGNAFLVDAGSRDVRGALQRGAASGATFMLALPFEALSILVDSPASTVSVPVTVSSTANCDWALPGQRVTLVGNGAAVNAIIQSVTATTITVVTVDTSWSFAFGTLGAAGRAGAVIMPVVPVLLDSAQGFSRYPARVDLWAIRAQALSFGFAGVDSMGIGTTMVTYTAGAAIPVATVTDSDLPIWDRANAIDGTASESMASGAEIVDLGALPLGIGAQTVPTWARSIKFRSASRDDWQWFKAFARHVRGRQGAFLLSTNRPDLVFDSYGVGGIKIKSSSVAGGGDYASWYASTSHRRLAITTSDGAITYVAVTAAPVDNGDGTLTLALDGGIFGTITKISFLETLRFERDDIEATWAGAVFSVDEIAVIARDTISTQPRVMYDTVVPLSFIGSFPGSNEFVLPAGGQSYLVRFSSDHTLTFGGISVAGGPIEGMVVTITCVNNNAFGLSCANEDTTFSPNHRMTNAGSALKSATGLHITYYYDSGTSRWFQIG
jgi:hypothetical protein